LDLADLLCATLKRFPDSKPLDIKGLVAIEQLAAWDKSSVLPLEWGGAYDIITTKMKVSG